MEVLPRLGTTSTSITLTLLTFHCNLYIIDDVGLFLKAVCPRIWVFCSKFYCNKCGGPPTMPEENRSP